MNDNSIPDASIVIVSFNTGGLLRESIKTLQREATSVSHETIVIDNGSRDGSAEMVAAEFPEVKLIRSETNLGFAAANNRGFEIARGRYIVLLNSDAFLCPGALRLSIEHMDAYPEAGLAGGRLVGRDGSWQPSARMFPSPLNALLMMSGLAAKYSRSRFFGRADQTWADPLRPVPVDWVPGAYSIIRRAVLDQVGFFDERFFLYYEEVDLCRRIKAAKHEIWYWPDIVTVHLGGESAKTLKIHKVSSAGSQLVLWRMRAELLYYRKHHGALGAWSAMLLENWWNRLSVGRNSLSHFDEGRAKIAEARSRISTMKQAWADTQGGRSSPVRPW
jgi:GT2 family glycosyltransferase